DIGVARVIANAVRERDGGLPGVRALGIELPSRRRVQVSMNLVALERTGGGAACLQVDSLAGEADARVVHIELVGLVPMKEWLRWSRQFVARVGLGADATIEGRLGTRSDLPRGR